MKLNELLPLLKNDEKICLTDGTGENGNYFFGFAENVPSEYGERYEIQRIKTHYFDDDEMSGIVIVAKDLMAKMPLDRVAMTIIKKKQEESTWADIKAAAIAGTLDSILAEGDQIPVTLKNGDVVVFDFTHDQNGKAYFVLHDCYGEHCMNKTATTKGGWRDSEMRRYVTEEILPLLPDDLLDVIAPTKIRQIRDGEELISEDKLFLLSYTQVFGGKWEDEPDDTQLEIFKKGTHRVKGDTEGGASWWWLRSADYYTSYSFNGVGSGGGSNSGIANYSYGVVLGFCII